MKIGIIEIIFSFMMFCVIWFIIFQVKLKRGEQKRLSLKNIEKSIDKHAKEGFIIDGKKVDLKGKLALIKRGGEPKAEENQKGGNLKMGKNQTTRGTKKKSNCAKCGRPYYPIVYGVSQKTTKHCSICRPDMYKKEKK